MIKKSCANPLAMLPLFVALLVLTSGQKLFAGGKTETLTWEGRTLVGKKVQQ